MAKRKKISDKFAPRGPSQQRPKSWSKKQEEKCPRRQRKRRHRTVILEDYRLPV
jgi:hypothetical protein